MATKKTEAEAKKPVEVMETEANMPVEATETEATKPEVKEEDNRVSIMIPYIEGEDSG